MNEMGINKVSVSPQMGGSRLEMSGNKALSNTKKMLLKSGSNVLPNIVTDYILQELRNLEKTVLLSEAVRRYDVLSEPLIYQREIYRARPDENKRSLRRFDLAGALIIKFFGIRPEEEEIRANGDTYSTVIMEFLRERYLSNFSKYSRHLTQTQRPTSRYYNTHQVKDLAMLSTTGGFSQEVRALPQWKI